jgi:hypothetical protein
MIQISEHIDPVNGEKMLDDFATNHWKYLKTTLIKDVQNELKTLKGKGYSDSLAYGSKDAVKRHELFYDFLLCDDCKNLCGVITGRPEKLLGMKKLIYAMLRPDDVYRANDRKAIYSTPFGVHLLDNVFRYKRFRSSKFCKTQLLSLGFGNATCVYCNDHKVETVEVLDYRGKKTNKAYYDIDHFYSMTCHPFFSLSFFNLIPSCTYCNTRNKLAKEFCIETHINPYHESFDNVFTFELSCVALNHSADKLEIVARSSECQKYKSVHDFNLVERYNNSNISDGLDIVDKYSTYQNYVNSEYSEVFKEFVLKGIPKTKNEILKYQRGKMKRDILKQIDCFNLLS